MTKYYVYYFKDILNYKAEGPDKTVPDYINPSRFDSEDDARNAAHASISEISEKFGGTQSDRYGYAIVKVGDGKETTISIMSFQLSKT